MGAHGSLFRNASPTPDLPHANDPLWTTLILCRRQKVALLPFFLSDNPRVDNRASTPFELVHSDVKGLCSVMFRVFIQLYLPLGLSISFLLLTISLVSLGFI